MKNALNEIIDETQSGFMKGRHISSNIRLVIDLVQYSILLNGDPRKAFDTVSHHFIFDSWKLFGFGQYFIKNEKLCTVVAIALLNLLMEHLPDVK